ncbi:MAG: hypothetical protein ABT02_10080 [Comamonadaceae bacterium SCN 68-20]|nr:hypothetical protein [Comamonadaceae bacterium]ODU59477.1 MAG: hypothetical protein ABT02_10080 [Comamonadaceae bacterium SCN 68-20]OJX36448.1 MAG: hypothetical protein BGO75_16240 [Burkholderiales bacterium 68-20]
MADLVNTCPSCGAEESLDVMFSRMVDDDIVRRAIHDVVIKSLPLGAMLLRYIRLHKPPKQRLRMTRLRELLSELAGDMARNVIERHGRTWAVTNDDWRGAFEAVFTAADKGTLRLPLQSNSYLYQVLSRQADEVEAAQEEKREQERRNAGRAHSSAAPTNVGELLAAAAPPSAAPRPAAYRVSQEKRRAMAQTSI